MNATVAAAKANKKPLAPLTKIVQVEQIAIDRIAASTENPRRSADKAALAELAASIRAVGIQVPLTLRYKRDDDWNSDYEIVSGERRWRAARMAGLTSVPAIVREMSDAECRDAALIENLQREDLPPLDEADAYAALIERLGSREALAARVGKTIEYVTRRLKLRTLIEPSRQALQEKLIALDHALLLSKLAPAEQEKSLRHALNYSSPGKSIEEVIGEAKTDRAEDDYWEPISVLLLKEYIKEEINLSLKSAPWDLTDAHLVESAGACANCEKNTAANTALFGDLAIKDASCMDAACYAAKKQAFVQIQVRAVEAAGKDAIRISWAQSNAKPIDGSVAAGQVFKAGQWIEAKKGECSFVGQGIAIDEDRHNSSHKLAAKLLVCVAAGCKKHPKAWERPKEQKKAGASGNRGGYDAKAEEEKRKQRAAAIAAAIAAENKIRAELFKQAIAKTTQLLPEAVRIIALQLSRFSGSGDWNVQKHLRSASAGSREFAAAVAALALSASGAIVEPWKKPDDKRAEFLSALKILGVDGKSAWAKEPEAKPAKSSPKQAGGVRPAAKAAAVSPSAAAAIQKLHAKAKTPAKKGGKP